MRRRTGNAPNYHVYLIGYIADRMSQLVCTSITRMASSLHMQFPEGMHAQPDIIASPPQANPLFLTSYLRPRLQCSNFRRRRYQTIARARHSQRDRGQLFAARHVSLDLGTARYVSASKPCVYHSHGYALAKVKLEDGAQHKNLRVWSVSSGEEVASFSQKSQEGWQVLFLPS